MSSIRGAAEAGNASNTATRAQRLALLTLSFQTLGTHVSRFLFTCVVVTEFGFEASSTLTSVHPPCTLLTASGPPQVPFLPRKMSLVGSVLLFGL